MLSSQRFEVLSVKCFCCRNNLWSSRVAISEVSAYAQLKYSLLLLRQIPTIGKHVNWFAAYKENSPYKEGAQWFIKRYRHGFGLVALLSDARHWYPYLASLSGHCGPVVMSLNKCARDSWRPDVTVRWWMARKRSRHHQWHQRAPDWLCLGLDSGTVLHEEGGRGRMKCERVCDGV